MKTKKAFKKVIKFYEKCLNGEIVGIGVEEDFMEKLRDDSEKLDNQINEIKFLVTLDSGKTFFSEAKGYMSVEELKERAKDTYGKHAKIEICEESQYVKVTYADKVKFPNGSLISFAEINFADKLKGVPEVILTDKKEADKN